jgi:SAM-dependent methyltransferase
MMPVARPPASQSDIDARNADYWDKKSRARSARPEFTRDDPDALAVFDTWYFEIYPYLERFVPDEAIRGKDVLEVGLGSGSMSQRLAERGARLTALDIAIGPAAVVRRRLSNNRLRGLALRGSILAPPFRPGSFDYVVAIGCYHHTGDLPGAIAQTAALLRDAGGATIMTYSATAYLRWIREPWRTLRYVASVAGGTPPPLPLVNTGEYDKLTSGQSAPETVLVSKTHFTRLLRRHFRQVQVSRANAASVPRLRVPRRVLLATLGRVAGLDLYAQVRK